MRGGRNEAKENLAVDEEGDCPRCGGDKQPSSIQGYLQCIKCNYEWADPDSSNTGPVHRASIHDEANKIEAFKKEMDEGELQNVLGIDQQLTKEQEQSLGRLQDRWIGGMAGHFNAAEEERKPLVISFDEDDNIQTTDTAIITIVGNDFDGGEEIRIEYPGIGTEFYTMDAVDERGWRKGRTSMDSARNIASIINRFSKLVHAHFDDERIILEIRQADLDPASLVVFIDDPGGKNLSLERAGIILDIDATETIGDYREMVKIVLEDGVISPSEDEMLWMMRRNLQIDEGTHLAIIQELFADDAKKECPSCHALTPFYAADGAWWCDACQEWL
jgi:ribosomal protein L37AE/L43A